MKGEVNYEVETLDLRASSKQAYHWKRVVQVAMAA